MTDASSDHPPLLLRRVEVDGAHVDVLIAGGAVAAIRPAGSRPPERGAEVVDGEGGALLPGLWDHHVHLLATAAAAASVDVGPARLRGADQLGAALRGAPGTSWVRAVGYHDDVAGPLDRALLDSLVDDRPVRVQHRSGAMWVLNSTAARLVGLDEPTGRLLRGDGWLRDRLPPGDPPDVAAVGRRLSGFGVVGVTDMTPSTRIDDVLALAGAGLDQRVVASGGPALADAEFPHGVGRGPVKLVVDDHDPPSIDHLAEQIRRAHGAGRAVAIHCVTRLALVLALAAWEQGGSAPGDRVEHGSVVPPELRAGLAAHRLAVVTQPSFVAERGDQYLAEVDPDDLPHLLPCATLLEAGIAVGGSTDAPYGDLDPWRAITAAVERRAPSGAALGEAERISAGRALDLFLTPPETPGGRPRRVVVGARADLCLLDEPLASVLDDPSSRHVRATFVGGRRAASVP